MSVVDMVEDGNNSAVFAYGMTFARLCCKQNSFRKDIRIGAALVFLHLPSQVTGHDWAISDNQQFKLSEPRSTMSTFKLLEHHQRKIFPSRSQPDRKQNLYSLRALCPVLRLAVRATLGALKYPAYNAFWASHSFDLDRQTLGTFWSPNGLLLNSPWIANGHERFHQHDTSRQSERFVYQMLEAALEAGR
ncbi:hypothetical protein BT63DRAFT_455687 [Microthyrium microscopicum]|uniref:Uncharacterized protein n=1 Tax=Microthyrium microscopicum TaxID=703497 RepID=A0A6A6UC41_9PEZI|nr:hypothetical protein BT63DRAFT_455687 [Microthyrium microscopicum]